MGCAFLARKFKNSQQETAKKARNKLSYHLTINPVAWLLFAADLPPVQPSVGAMCQPWGHHTALLLLGTAVMLHEEQDQA